MGILFLLTVVAVVILLTVPNTSGKCWCNNKKNIAYLCSNLDNKTIHIPFIHNDTYCNKLMNRISELHVKKSNIPFLSEKMFSQLPFTWNVTKLFLSGNNISEINKNAFKSFTKVEELDLSHNKLKEDQIVKAVCFNAPLKNLHLDLNPIGNISSSTFDCSNSTSTKAIQMTLSNLTMSGCDIQHIENHTFVEFRKLNTLNLNENNLSSLIFLEHLSTKLSFLHVAYNQLEDISIFNESPSHVESLIQLSLDGNPIRIPRAGFLASLSKLRFLWLQHTTTVTKFPPMNLPELTNLQISYNNFTTPATDTFNNVPKLQFLDMTSNDLGNLSALDLPKMFLPLRRLRKLILKKTKLTCSIGSTFSYMRNMSDLDLSENKISNISGAFQTLTNIRTLLLNNNSISLVEPSDLPPAISSKLDLSGNPFECTCALAPFRTEYIPQHHKTIRIYKTKSYVCHGPMAFKGKQLREFNPKYTECHGFNPYVITAIAVCVILILIVIVASVADACKHRIKRYLEARKLTRQYTKISNSSVSDDTSPSTL